MPVLLVLLVLIFGGLVSASLPLLVGGLAILGSFTALHALTYVTDVSIFAVNITTFLGLGLAIDYGLFMVSRFREEIDRDGATGPDALAATMATAGRTVAVSGVTVAVSLSGLLLFDQNFLVSMGYGGIATVFVCMLGALTVLPALLAVLGPRVNALPVRRRRRGAESRFDGWWERVARSVMRRPVIYVVATVALLLALGAPFLRINWGGVDAKVLPDGTEARVVSETLETGFARNSTSPIEAVVTGTSDQAAIQAYGARLDAVPGVTGATVTGSEGRRRGSRCATTPTPTPAPRATSSGRCGRCPHRTARRPTSAASPPTWSTSSTASARRCRGSRWSSAAPRSSCSSWRSGRCCCR